MLSYCLKCRKTTEGKNTKVVRTKTGKILLLLKCAVCISKKQKFVKEQETRGIWDKLNRLKSPFMKW